MGRQQPQNLKNLSNKGNAVCPTEGNQKCTIVSPVACEQKDFRN